jgi:putative colanic acid biosysnthesis UDP-glucose lipid carrier transferase
MYIDRSLPDALDARMLELSRGMPVFNSAGGPPLTQSTDSTSVFPTAPQSVPVFVAALAEPLLAVLCLLLSSLWFGQPMDRSVMLLSVFTMTLMFPGTNRFYERPSNSAVDIVAAWAAVVAILFLCGYASDSLRFFRRDVAATWVLSTPVAQLAFVLAGRWLMRRYAGQPEHRRPALVIGGGPLGARVADAILAREPYGQDLIGYVEDRQPDRCDERARDRLLGGLDDLPSLIHAHRVKDAYITFALSNQPRIRQMISVLQDAAVSIYLVPDVFGVNVIQGRMRNMDGVPVVSLLESPFVGLNGLVKRLTDIVLASLILVLIAPVLLAVAIGVKFSSPGPVIFRQRRNGLDGDEIVVYKFRSMRVMENGAKVTQATKGDSRVTPFGAFIRRTSLDELPQFINVLQGRMSIVGPRPHAVAHNEQYRPIIRSYMVRHKVKPGITGWAQVNGCRGETDVVEKMAARVHYDLEYLRSWSLGLDLRIIARTVRQMFFDRSAY